ncbi:MAG TPA: YciI family protein, partial [Vicinamibacterales bacterium]
TRMQELIEEGMKGGWLVSTEGCLPSVKGARVRRANGKTTVTDGPFTESKELVAGFAILEAASKQEAIELTRKFLEVAGGGECELRQVFTAADVAPTDAVCTHAQLVEQIVR